MFNKKKKEIEKLNAEVKRLKDERDNLLFKILDNNGEILKLQQTIKGLRKTNIKLMINIREIINNATKE